jgi:hypothetical protein
MAKRKRRVEVAEHISLARCPECGKLSLLMFDEHDELISVAEHDDKQWVDICRDIMAMISGSGTLQ